MNPFVHNQPESPFNPFTFRQIRDQFNSRPGVFADASLDSYARGMNEMFGTNQYDAGTSPVGNFFSGISAGIDDWLESTGLPEKSGNLGEQVGGWFGFPEVGREVFQQVPRQTIDYAPMFIGGGLGAVGKLAAARLPLLWAGAMGSAPLVGMNVFEKTNSLQEAAVAGGLTAATPALFGIGGAIGEALVPKATGFAQRLANYVGGNVALNAAFTGADIAQHGTEILTKEYWAAQALGNIPFMALDLPDLLMPPKVAPGVKADPVVANQVKQEDAQAALLEQQKVLAEQRRAMDVRTNTTTKAAEIISEELGDADPEFVHFLNQRMDEVQRGELQSIKEDLGDRQNRVNEFTSDLAETELTAITLDQINEIQADYLRRIETVDQPHKRVELKKRLDEVVTGLVSQLRKGPEGRTDMIAGESIDSYLRRKRVGFLTGDFMAPANKGLQEAYAWDVQEIKRISGPNFVDVEDVKALYQLYGGDKDVNPKKLENLVGNPIPDSFDVFREMIAEQELPAMLGTKTKLSKEVRIKFRSRIEEFWQEAERASSTDDEGDTYEYELAVADDLKPGDVIDTEQGVGTLAEIQQTEEGVRLVFDDGSEMLVEADQELPRRVVDEPEDLAESLGDVSEVIDTYNYVADELDEPLMTDDVMADKVEEFVEDGLDFEEGVQRLVESMKSMVKQKVDNIPSNNDVDDIPYSNSPDDTDEYIASMGEAYNDAEVRRYAELVELAHVEGHPAMIKKGVKEFARILRTDRAEARKIMGGLEGLLNNVLKRSDEQNRKSRDVRVRNKQAVIDTVRKFQHLGVIRSFSNGKKDVNLISAINARHGAFRDKTDGTIYISAAIIARDFESKVWTKPRKLEDETSAAPMHPDAFLDVRDWAKFVLYHERLHGVLPKLPDEKMGDYENRINAEARKLVGVKSDGRTAELRVTLSEARQELQGNAPTPAEVANKNKKLEDILYGSRGVLPRNKNYKSPESVIGDVRRMIGKAYKQLSEAKTDAEKAKGLTMLKEAHKLQVKFASNLANAIEKYPHLRIDLEQILKNLGAKPFGGSRKPTTVGDQAANKLRYDYPSGLPINVILRPVSEGWAFRRADGELEIVKRPVAEVDFTREETLEAVEASKRMEGGLRYPELERLHQEYLDGQKKPKELTSLKDFEDVEGPLAKQPIKNLQIALQNFLNVVDTNNDPAVVQKAAKIFLSALDGMQLQVRIDNQAKAAKDAYKDVPNIIRKTNTYKKYANKIVQQIRSIVEHYHNNPPQPVVRPERAERPFVDPRFESFLSPFRQVGPRFNAELQKHNIAPVFQPRKAKRNQSVVLNMGRSLAAAFRKAFNQEVPNIKFRYFDMTKPAEDVTIFHPLLRAIGVVDHYLTTPKGPKFVTSITKDHAGETGILVRGKKAAVEALKAANYPQEAISLVEKLYDIQIQWSKSFDADKAFAEHELNPEPRPSTTPDLEPVQQAQAAPAAKQQELFVSDIEKQAPTAYQIAKSVDLVNQRDLLIQWWKANPKEREQLTRMVDYWEQNTDIQQIPKNYNDLNSAVNKILVELGIPKGLSDEGVAALRRLVEQSISRGLGYDPKMPFTHVNESVMRGKDVEPVEFVTEDPADFFDEGPISDLKEDDRPLESRKRGDYKRIRVVYSDESPGAELIGQPKRRRAPRVKVESKPEVATDSTKVDEVAEEGEVVDTTPVEGPEMSSYQEALVRTREVDPNTVDVQDAQVELVVDGVRQPVGVERPTEVEQPVETSRAVVEFQALQRNLREKREGLPVVEQLFKNTSFLPETSSLYQGEIKNWRALPNEKEVGYLDFIQRTLGLADEDLVVVRRPDSVNVMKVWGDGKLEVNLENLLTVAPNEVELGNVLNEEILHFMQFKMERDGKTPEVVQLKEEYIRLLDTVSDDMFRSLYQEVRRLYPDYSKEKQILEVEARAINELLKKSQHRKFITRLKNWWNRVVHYVSGGKFKLNTDNLVVSFLASSKSMWKKHASATYLVDHGYTTGYLEARMEPGEITAEVWKEVNDQFAKHKIKDAEPFEKLNYSRVGSGVKLQQGNWREILNRTVAEKDQQFAKVETFYRQKYDVPRERARLEAMANNQEAAQATRDQARRALEAMKTFGSDEEIESYMLSKINQSRAENVSMWQAGFGYKDGIGSGVNPRINGFDQYRNFIFHGLQKFFPRDSQETQLPFVRKLVHETLVEFDLALASGKPYNFFKAYRDKLKAAALQVSSQYPTLKLENGKTWVQIDSSKKVSDITVEDKLAQLKKWESHIELGGRQKPNFRIEDGKLYGDYYSPGIKKPSKLEIKDSLSLEAVLNFYELGDFPYSLFPDLDIKWKNLSTPEQLSPIDALTVLSSASWCTSQGSAKYYVEGGICNLLLDENGGGISLVTEIGFENDRQWREWQGVKNNGTYPEELYPELQALGESDFVGKEVKNKIQFLTELSPVKRFVQKLNTGELPTLFEVLGDPDFNSTLHEYRTQPSELLTKLGREDFDLITLLEIFSRGDLPELPRFNYNISVLFDNPQRVELASHLLARYRTIDRFTLMMPAELTWRPGMTKNLGASVTNEKSSLWILNKVDLATFDLEKAGEFQVFGNPRQEIGVIEFYSPFGENQTLQFFDQTNVQKLKLLRDPGEVGKVKYKIELFDRAKIAEIHYNSQLTEIEFVKENFIGNEPKLVDLSLPENQSLVTKELPPWDDEDYIPPVNALGIPDNGLDVPWDMMAQGVEEGWFGPENLHQDWNEELADLRTDDLKGKPIHNPIGFKKVVEEVAGELGISSAEQREAYIKRANFLENLFHTPLAEYGRLIADGAQLGQTKAKLSDGELFGIDIGIGEMGGRGLDAKSAEQVALITQAHEAVHAVEQLAKAKKLNKDAQRAYDDWMYWSNNAMPEERAAVLDIMFSKYGKRTTGKVREMLYNKSRMQKLAENPVEFRAYVGELWARGQMDHAGLNKDITLLDMLTYVPREVFNWFKTVATHAGRLMKGMFGIARRYGHGQAGFKRAEQALATVSKSLQEAQRMHDGFESVLTMGTRGFSELGIRGFVEERFNLDADGNQVYSHPGQAGLPKGKSDTVTYARRLLSGFTERIENFLHFPQLRPALSSVIQYMSGIASDSTMAMAPIFGGYNQATGSLNAQAGSKRYADIEKLTTNRKVNRAFSLIAEEMRKREHTQIISGKQLGDTEAGRYYRSLDPDDRRIVDELLPEYVNSAKELHNQVVVKLKIVTTNIVANYLSHKFGHTMPFEKVYELAQRLVDNTDIILHPETLGPNIGLMQSAELQAQFAQISSEGLSVYQRSLDLARKMLVQRDEIKAYFDQRPAFLTTGDFGLELNWVQRNQYDQLDNMFGGLLRKLDDQRNKAIDEMTDISESARHDLKHIFNTQSEVERLIASERRGRTAEELAENYKERVEKKRSGKDEEWDVNVPEAHRKYVNLVTGIMNSQILNSRLRFEMNRPELQKGKMKLRADQFMQMVENFKIPDTELGRWMNKALFQYTMGLNISNHMLELMQPYFSFLPLIISEGDMSPIEGVKFMNKASGKAAEYFAQRSGAWVTGGGKDLQNEPWKKIMGKEGQEFFDLFNLFGLKKLISMSYLSDQMGEPVQVDQPMMDARQLSRGGKLWKDVKKAGGSLIGQYTRFTKSMYGHATQHNARTAAIIGWWLAKKRMPNEPVYVSDPNKVGGKMLNPKLVEEAELFVVSGTFGSGRYGRPSIPFSSANPVVRTAAMMYNGLQTYSQGMLGMYGRFLDKSFNKTEYPWMTDQERLRARQALGTMLAVGFGSAGMLGMPFVAALMQIVENTTELEPRAKMRQLLSRLFGEDEAQGGFLTDFATRGGVNAILAQTGFQPDIASRVSLGGMFGMDAYNGFTTENLLGPSWQIASDLVKGAGEFAKGDWNAGWKDVLPVAWKRPAGLLMDSGEIRDLGGAVIADTTWADKFVHAIGFTPQRVSKMREGSRLAKRSRELQTLQDVRWHEALAAELERDPEGVRRKLLDRQDQSSGRYSAREGAQRVAEYTVKRALPKDPRMDASAASAPREEEIFKTMEMNSLAPSASERMMMEAQVMQMLGFDPNLTPAKIAAARKADQMIGQMPWMTYSTAKDLAENHPY